MTIQDRLRQLKQIDAAARLGVAKGFVSEIMRNKKAPSVPMAARIADRLGCSDEELGASVRQWASSSSSSTGSSEAA